VLATCECVYVWMGRLLVSLAASAVLCPLGFGRHSAGAVQRWTEWRYGMECSILPASATRPDVSVCGHERVACLRPCLGRFQWGPTAPDVPTTTAALMPLLGRAIAGGLIKS
jgi:hypothetical protein